MPYRWHADLAPGTETTPDDLVCAGIGMRFDDQAAAEEWLGAFYADLQDLGVSQVSLFEEDRLVYGPMSLDE
ncbi:hypothetical protein [Brooklawnia cerclae]|uniref:Uncharacterized protein n=1 Tax=Brooklawnia cerclae TaxID=349934 RepID=A0ABX0SHW9_9ACTN|nr:hypothetical protein [Brooklawnia cerclae]NIH57565.1 hypothetical protein [Brooklawnia cerclae]